MISVTIDTSGNAPQVLVRLDRALANRKDLHQLLAMRLVEELQKHFRKKNGKPNKLGGQRTNFWSSLAKQTAISRVTEAGAQVTVADRRLRLHVYGGTIRPKEKKALTIPLVAAAHGRSVAQYEEIAGVELFQVKGKNALFQKVGESVRPIYALRKSATIKKDDEALPAEATLQSAMLEETQDYLDLIDQQSNLA